MRLLHIFISLAWLTGSVAAIPLAAWGPEGHRVVGTGALPLLDSTARIRVVEILGSESNERVARACFWPDTVRKTPEWEWSAPLHFVNIPADSMHFDRDRDCSDGMCITDAIVKYANELTLAELSPERRWQALAWLCHLVGDLHQPLHAGYRSDRGGNYFEITYQGQTDNLHQFWDRLLIRERLGANDTWILPYPDSRWTERPATWNPANVVLWTDESHALVATSAYPPSRDIEPAFADQSWLITRQQWQKASYRLAGILNAVLGEGQVRK